MIEEKDADKIAEDVAKDMFGSWLKELEKKDQPEVCTIDDPDCEACGS
mgnify:FL=1